MRRTLGVAVFAGVIGVTLFGIFLTPVFYYVVMRLTGQAGPGAAPAPPRSPRWGASSRRTPAARTEPPRPRRSGPAAPEPGRGVHGRGRPLFGGTAHEPESLLPAVLLLANPGGGLNRRRPEVRGSAEGRGEPAAAPRGRRL